MFHNDPSTALPPRWFAKAMTAALAPVTRTANVAFNLNCGDGHSRIFKIIPFVSGDDPTKDPYNLPPLLNVRVLGQLTDDQITAYLQGYNIQNAANGIEAIRVEIGCTASYKDI